MNMTCQQFYRNKTILLTGGTGFVGKVLLDKLLRAFPEIKNIFLMIRVKKGSNVNERFKKEVLGSQCFDLLRKQLGVGFDSYISSKVTPIEGDLLKENLNLSQATEQQVVQNVQIIINCAASVDFNAPLKLAIENNYFGTFRILQMAKKVKNLENFLHISTAYVNSDQFGYIEEKIYEDQKDVDKIISELMNTPGNFNEKQTKNIIGKFPNTYTFTKSLTERMLMKKRPPGMQITILRPSIIGCSFKEPIPGWIDNMIGSAGQLFYIGIGLVQVVKGDGGNITDQIPVDFVVNHIIVAGAFTANKNCLEVQHICSSSRNPLYIKVVSDTTVQYWSQNIPTTRVGPASITFSSSELSYRILNLKRTFPAQTLKVVANVFGTEQMRKNAKRVINVLGKADLINDAFCHFNSHEWIFDTPKTSRLIELLRPEEQQIFYLDVSALDWKTYYLLFNYGIQKFILKENVDPPGDPQSTDLLSLWKESSLSDLKWAKSKGAQFKTKTKKEHLTLVMNSQRVQQVLFLVFDIKKVLKQVQKARMDKSGRITQKDAQKIHSELYRSGLSICESMFADYNFRIIRMTAWFLNKFFKQVYEKVIVDEAFLTKLSYHDAKTQGPLIFVPTHKSYMDFLLASYILYAFKIRCPHIASTEDFLQMSLIPQMLRWLGCFFEKQKSFEKSPLTKAIFYEYVQRLLIDDCYLAFFVENTRSRTGKIISPQFDILGIVIDTVIENKLPDATIIPFSINYEKVMEAETYPLELLGENKVKESLFRVISAAKSLQKNQGRVYVEFGEPISIRKELKTFNEQGNQKDPNNIIQDRQQFVEQVGFKIFYSLIDKLIIMPTSMVAAIILMHRKGIQEEQLVKKIEWLAIQIQSRGGTIRSINDCSAVMSVRNAIIHLRDTVIKNKRNIFELSLTPDLEYKNILLLNYYKNQLLHVFFEEAICTCSLYAFGLQLAYNEGIDQNRLWEEFEFLYTLLDKEVMLRNPIRTQEKFKVLLNQMIERGILCFADEMKTIIKVNEKTGEQSMAFLCSLIWPLVESYLATILYIYSIQTNPITTITNLVLHTQWFAESLQQERVMEYYESCSSETILNALRTYNSLKIITIGQRDVNDRGTQIEEYIEQVAGEDEVLFYLFHFFIQILQIQSHIRKFMKNSFTKSVNQPIDILRKNKIEFPLMGRL